MLTRFDSKTVEKFGSIRISKNTSSPTPLVVDILLVTSGIFFVIVLINDRNADADIPFLLPKEKNVGILIFVLLGEIKNKFLRRNWFGKGACHCTGLWRTV